jgi:hypothetical protein
MLLRKITSIHISQLFGLEFDSDKNVMAFTNDPQDFGLVLIGQALDCSSYLILVTKEHKNFEKISSIPEGYDFVFRQSWGLVIYEDTIHRVISTLREEAYPPMSDYLDAKVKGDTAQEQAYLNACLAVKEKYPKFSW